VALTLLAPTEGLALARRACLLGAAGCVLSPSSAHASYALSTASAASQSWEATGKAREQAVYDRIDATLMEKRRFRDSAEEVGNYLGGDYTNYRRGAGRDKFEAEKAAKAKTSGSSNDWARPEDILLMQARRSMIAQP